MSAVAESGVGQEDDVDFAQGIPALRETLIRQRKYTLALYAELPPAYWQPAQFPYLPIVNPPLWELAHIAWFAEFFCLRWRCDDILGLNTPSVLAVADSLFNSKTVPHGARWSSSYPDRQVCLDYMQRSLDAVLASLDASAPDDRDRFRLAIAHEDMHAEALTMTLVTLGLPLPVGVPARCMAVYACRDLGFDGGSIELGASARRLRFDNEAPAWQQEVAPFSIASRPVSALEFAAFVESPDYVDDRIWSAPGRQWRLSRQQLRDRPGEPLGFAAMHVNYFEAEAWCRWASRRLPTEAEWEFAASRSPELRASTGQVWEWTSSIFAPYPGFSPGRYRDYSEPWFHTHQVLKGGSFATHPRLKYPQYRNFYTPERSDMFCGFRTCAIA
ncbi:MAG: SUMF1/EgtB/PvdO family nonheme iron enzyme [Betaproteobacteria bacterium]|nr:SUMF1/EgtB/PvdO family nonheme iron enzyme [Betaproteobacteria bacterium]